MKKYFVRINCTSSQIIEVEAENKVEAKELALIKFNCESLGKEFCEFVTQ